MLRHIRECFRVIGIFRASPLGPTTPGKQNLNLIYYHSFCCLVISATAASQRVSTDYTDDYSRSIVHIQTAIIHPMLHRHLNHSEWTLAAIDDVIARGRLDDWKELRDAAVSRKDIQERILRVSKPHLSDPYAQRYHFWNFYVRKQFA